MMTDCDSVSNGSDTTAVRGKSDESKSSGETYSHASRANGDSTLQQIGLQETKIVRSSKICVYVFLLLVAIGGSLLTWLFLKEEEQLSLAQQFDVLAKEILAVSTLNALKIFALFEAEALQITTHAMTTGQEWPFFTLDLFEVEAELLHNQSKAAEYIAIHPIVQANQKEEWENYAISKQGWLVDSYQYYGVSGTPSPICPVISSSSTRCTPAENRTDGIYVPAWQIAPPTPSNEQLINYDGLSSDSFSMSFFQMMDTKDLVVADAVSLQSEDGYPVSLLLTPIHKGVRRQLPIVAVLVGVIPWNDFFENLLPEGEDGIIVVVSNQRQAFTFEINGPSVDYLGQGDLHDAAYDSFVNVNDFAGYTNGTSDLGFVLSVYPSQEFEADHVDNSTLVYTLAVAFVFLFAMSVFFVYDFFVEQRQTKVMQTATKSSAIVNSLFPANVRDRLLEEHAQGGDKKYSAFQAGGLEEIPSSKPIADLFPEATVMFADLAGFTAWSSIREPSQVFFLLESLYNSFDKIARKMKVFKVETIGDSYVAVAGLPDPRKDHAEVMARFAHKCLVKTNTLMHALETTLGPGTSDLKMRIGLHSGPVTAGVLRGEKSRFQLFGDTVNTAARMESTGVKNRIHLSKETADLIIAGGKEQWIKPRSTKVFAKGKGELQTFWYAQGTESDTTDGSETGHSSSYRSGNNSAILSTVALDKTQTRASSERLVLWNVENLCLPLKKLIVSRKGQKPLSIEAWRKLQILSSQPGGIVLDEVEEVITLPENGVVDFGSVVDSVVLDKQVVEQLTNFVTTIASMYHSHAFHNFDHASHVAQSVTKLLSRVVTPDQVCYESMSYTPKAAPDKLHHYTFGITSNPLIHFAVILSALIHDVDHPGVPNSTLVSEGAEMAITYRNKSVAEQNSVDLAWGLLMEPQYEDLRRCIYTTQEELESFRKLLVNAVLATDVMDKELGNLRKRRWDLAFRTETTDTTSNDSTTMTNRKATIVIEYLIQASDVAHTMQHWQIYTHWNEKFFQECYKAYKDGRSEKDPTDGWYDGELGFFDFYVIPLANRLKECGVFGVSSAEYLNYAVSNREEWSRRGKEMVALYLENLGIIPTEV